MRVLVCTDPTPASDGSCAATAWLEVPTWTDSLPTVDQAQAVGFSVFAAICIIGAMRLLLPPKESFHE